MDNTPHYNMSNQKSGILLHISSLPSPYGIGDFGPSAYKFVDFLVETKQRFWQVLPFNPTEPVFGNSPYSSISVFAGNPLFISPDLLIEDGLLDKRDVMPLPMFPMVKCDYLKVASYKHRLFSRAYKNFKGGAEFEKFCSENSDWLDDFSLFEKFLQYIFHKQWFALKRHCNKNGVKIIGDIPMYVCCDSVDVWKNPELFNLDEEKKPITVSGVPPDYFSKTGQLWGNPVYRWDVLKETNYKWWVDRIAHNLKLFDIIKLDHFRGFVGYWEVPANEKTAVNGRWVKADAVDFFSLVARKFPRMPFIAENLGVITGDVKDVIKRFNLTGMRVLLFAFGDDDFVEIGPNCVVYTGTHDNNTVKGWFKNEAGIKEKERLFRYLGHKVNSNSVHLEFMRLAMKSAAKIAIFPMQDVLGLGSRARMNTPSTTKGNWQWRLLPHQIEEGKEIWESCERIRF